MSSLSRTQGAAVALRRFRSLAFLPVIGAFALGSMTASEALAVAMIPDSVSPGQVSKRGPGEDASKRLKLNIPAPIEAQKVSEQMRAKLEKQKFQLQKVLIEGAVAYQPQELAFAYRDKIGQSISLLDAREIANRITTFYRNNGYILTQAVVPAQEISSGTLKIRIVEGFISDVVFDGDTNSAEEQARLTSYANNIKNMRPTNMSELERYMLLMNDLPGSTITGLIRPSNAQFGAADLVLTVRHRQFEAAYTFDNRGSKYLGPWQHTLIADANSLFGVYDHTRLRLMTVHPLKSLFLAELQHDQLLDNEGTKLSLTASHTRTRPGDDLKPLRIVGQSDFFQIKLSHPFLRSRQMSFVARGAFDVRNSAVDVFSDVSLTKDRLRVARVGATYNFLDDLQGSDSIDVQISQGMNIFGSTNKGNERSNPIGTNTFTKVNFDMSRLQPLPDGFSILTAATGQFSFEPLFSDEKFSLGGSDFGRAFDPGTSLGDSGLAGKIEVRYDDIVEEPFLESYQLFGSFDIGEVWTRGTAAGSDLGSMSMASVGVGTRVRFTDWLSSTLEFNSPIVKPKGDQTDFRHNPRIYFSMTARF